MYRDRQTKLPDVMYHSGPKSLKGSLPRKYFTKPMFSKLMKRMIKPMFENSSRKIVEKMMDYSSMSVCFS